MPTPRTTRRVWLAAGLVAAALVAVVVGVVGTRAGQPDAAPAPSDGGRTSAASPSPTPVPPVPDVPRQDAGLTAPPVQVEPVHLTLPALEIELPVDPVGVAEDGQMEIPPHAERAGWYQYGPVPGSDRGTAVIAAHVDSIASAGLGPFARLQELVPGDEADVALADGSVLRFAVDEVTSVPKTDVTWPDVFDREGPSRLVLVTCGGTWDPDVRHYSNNVIVSLTPVGEDGAE